LKQTFNMFSKKEQICITKGFVQLLKINIKLLSRYLNKKPIINVKEFPVREKQELTSQNF